jgi:hypothetical protein
MLPTLPSNFFQRPFAAAGTLQVIPDAKQAEGRASLQEGFPVETQLPLSAGGIAPNRTDFNGILFMLSAFAFWQQSGGLFQFRTDLDYNVPSVVFHNGNLWWCMQPSGPSQASGAVAPGSNVAYWISLLEFLAGSTAGGGGSAGSIFGDVGDIKMHYGTTAPNGWFPCTGYPFSATTYPKLFTKVGKAVTPDMRGLFPRGIGGLSAALGVKQGHAMRRFTSSNTAGTIRLYNFDGFPAQATGCFSYDTGNTYGFNVPSAGRHEGRTGTAIKLDFSASGVPMDDEVRPDNMAVLFCIKHD